LSIPLYRILRCEPRKPNLIDRDPRPYQCFVGTWFDHCEKMPRCPKAY
jgi:hypothetical protein